jgi:tRNA(Ile)-lysidine synthase
VLQTIRRRALLGDADRVAVAISGGPDSVALAWVLRELEAKARWRVAGLIHVHHGLRGPEADADEAFCRALAGRMDLSIDVVHRDVTRRSREARLSVEAAARQVRYEAFEAARARLGASLVATGHTLDDQAETVLLRVLRGAGSRGMAAIRARLGPVIRPLIDARRSAVLEYLDGRREAFREDSTNRDLTIPRNRVRARLMPIVESDWPGGVRALARFAELAADDEGRLAEESRAASAHRRLEDGGVEIDLHALNPLPKALACRVLREAIEVAGGRPAFRDVDAIARLARADKPHGRLDLPGLTVAREGMRLRVGARVDAHPHAAPQLAARPLTVPGEVTLTETGTMLRASFQDRADVTARPSRDGQVAFLQADALQHPLAVRYRRPGDRLRPLGAPGTRKLQDWFVDRKVPRAARDRVPLVVDACDRIVWVAGFTIAHECRVTAPRGGVVVLELDKGNK